MKPLTLQRIENLVYEMFHKKGLYVKEIRGTYKTLRTVITEEAAKDSWAGFAVAYIDLRNVPVYVDHSMPESAIRVIVDVAVDC